MAIKLGTTVQQIVTPICGVVVSKQFDEVADKFQFLVENTDSEGQVHSRWFDEDQLEETK
jgi:adenine deaminase